MKDRVEEYLAEKYEGRLFAHVWVRPNIGAREFWCMKDYYTVKNGKVCLIEGDKLTESGDPLNNLSVHCRRIGMYEPGKTYERKSETLSYSELQKRLFK